MRQRPRDAVDFTRIGHELFDQFSVRDKDDPYVPDFRKRPVFFDIGCPYIGEADTGIYDLFADPDLFLVALCGDPDHVSDREDMVADEFDVPDRSVSLLLVLGFPEIVRLQ